MDNTRPLWSDQVEEIDLSIDTLHPTIEISEKYKKIYDVIIHDMYISCGQFIIYIFNENNSHFKEFLRKIHVNRGFVYSENNTLSMLEAILIGLQIGDEYFKVKFNSANTSTLTNYINGILDFCSHIVNPYTKAVPPDLQYYVDKPILGFLQTLDADYGISRAFEPFEKICKINKAYDKSLAVVYPPKPEPRYFPIPVPAVNKINVGAGICKFYNTPRGCFKGSGCQYLHQKVEGFNWLKDFFRMLDDIENVNDTELRKMIDDICGKSPNNAIEIYARNLQRIRQLL